MHLTLLFELSCGWLLEETFVLPVLLFRERIQICLAFIVQVVRRYLRTCVAVWGWLAGLDPLIIDCRLRVSQTVSGILCDYTRIAFVGVVEIEDMVDC